MICTHPLATASTALADSDVSPRPRAASDRELSALLLCAAEPVVVESYHGGWEDPWRGLSAADWRELLRELGERVNGVTVETGRNRGFAMRHGLEIIPAVLVFLDGHVVARFSGRTRVADVVAAVRSALRQARARESAARELEAAGADRGPLRSILRRRADAPAERTLARAC